MKRKRSASSVCQSESDKELRANRLRSLRSYGKRLKSNLSLNELPNEIILNIFKYLEFKDLGRCAKVSKRFRGLTNDQSLWQSINLDFKKIPQVEDQEYIESQFQGKW